MMIQICKRLRWKKVSYRNKKSYKKILFTTEPPSSISKSQSKDTKKTALCKACGEKSHSRRSSKACKFYEAKSGKDIPAAESSHFIIKSNLRNSMLLSNRIMLQSFCNEVRRVVEHNRDVSYIMSMFVNYFIVRCIRDNQAIPKLSHTKFIYPVMSIIIGLGRPTPLYDMIRNAFNGFVQEINQDAPLNEPIYRAENYRSIGYTSILTQTAKIYTELIKNHVAHNFETRTVRYFLKRMSNRDDAFYVDTTVSNRRYLSNFISKYASITKRPNILDSRSIPPGLTQIAIGLMNECLPYMDPPPFEPDCVKASCERYLLWLYRVMLGMKNYTPITRQGH
ncbi:MAG: hypothetical protein EXX96DRAFT_336749 [Benjaminiella poitrasii]|nr:MAG: hypothetical protein EXX96DRAFT_336749 [Benjaminiella poitrasii]